MGGFEFILITGTENVKGIPPFADGVRRMGQPQMQRPRENQKQVQQQKQNCDETNYLSDIIPVTEGFIVGKAEANGGDPPCG
jgi:hypothetical protein